MTEKTRVVSVRLPVEVADYYAEIGLREVLTDIAERGVNTSVNTNSKNINNDSKSVNTKGESLVESYLLGITAESFYEQIASYLDSGEIWVENGKVTVRPKIGKLFEGYVDACEEKGLDVMEKLKKDTQMIRSMRVGGAGGA